MKYKTSSYLRSPACGRPACWPGRLRDWEQDRRSGSRSAGSEAIVMRAGPAGRLARAAGSGECAPQNVPRAPPERTQQARRRPPEHFRCVESVEKHRFSSFAASPRKMRSIFCERLAKMQQPCPCAEGAPAQRHMFCLCARRVAFFREGKFFGISGFSHTAPFAIRAGFGKKAKPRQG